jgi:hypothetical protein
MTNPPRKRTCDFCKKEIDSGEMSYKIQFNQNPPFGTGTKNQFVSSVNKADLCKTMESTDKGKTWHEQTEVPQTQLA